MPHLPADFFAADTLAVARRLLGARLVRRYQGERLCGIIAECEAYIGQEDSACHASRGRTPRTTTMFGPPGRAYVYRIYGLHWMLNVVTEPEGQPAAVLVRALVPVEGIATMRALRGGSLSDRRLADGPGKLAQALAIDGSHNGHDLTTSADLWLEPGNPVADARVQTGPRIGIEYAAEHDRLRPWRFWFAP